MSADWNQRIGHAKATIDNGFSRMGSELRSDNAVDRLLVGGASRIIRLANAVALLCKHHHAPECGPLLRSMFCSAMAMRWMAAAGEVESSEALCGQTMELDWGCMASDRLWQERLRSAGVADEERVGWMSALAGLDDIRTPAPAGLPWAHVFAQDGRKPIEPEEALRLASRAMGHALKALDSKWPGSFAGAEELWS